MYIICIYIAGGQRGKVKDDMNAWMILSLVVAWVSLCVGFGGAATSLPKPLTLVLHYYKLNSTCKSAETSVRDQLELAWNKPNGHLIVPQLLRLLYTDCFVTVSHLCGFITEFDNKYNCKYG